MVSIQLEKATAKARQAIFRGLMAYNRSQLGPRKWRQFAVTIRDEDGGIVGGATGEAWSDWLFVQLLWVDERFRGGDHATTAMDQLEDAARRFGCTNAYVDTFSFQARPFYEKRGYRVFGQLEGYPDEHTRYWLTKAL